MGRPREHDERTAAALLSAAERVVMDGGIDALSVRGVAADVGTTTRAVYSLFGSKDGLLAALAARPFELLHEGLDALPVTDDAAADLVAAALMFRRFSSEHPSLFALGIRQIPVSETVAAVAWESLDVLKAKVQRLADAGRLNGRTVDGATLQFHALCEGMAAVERRGMGIADWEALWRQAFEALVGGFAAQPATASQLGVELLERLLRLASWRRGRLRGGARVVPRRRVGELVLQRGAASASARLDLAPRASSPARCWFFGRRRLRRPAAGAAPRAGAGLARLAGPLGLRALLAHAHVLGPAADVGVQRLVLDRDRARADGVEQRAVVGDQQQRARERLQRRLERLAALEVEVVGRLVEDQHVGARVDEDRQRQPPALAAGQARRAASRPPRR